MINNAQGIVEISGGGKTWQLQLTVNGLCNIEGRLPAGSDFQKLFAEAPSLTTIRLFVWGALQQHHPGTTLEQAGDVIDAVGLQQATVAFTKAMTTGVMSRSAAGGDAGPLALAAGESTRSTQPAMAG